MRGTRVPIEIVKLTLEARGTFCCLITELICVRCSTDRLTGARAAVGFDCAGAWAALGLASLLLSDAFTSVLGLLSEAAFLGQE